MLISYGDLVGFCGIKLSKEDGIRIAKTGDWTNGSRDFWWDIQFGSVY
jgi:hypothetical protein